jgi:thiosulfate/3-mercaptopyruvate sulfurtransferase
LLKIDFQQALSLRIVITLHRRTLFNKLFFFAGALATRSYGFEPDHDPWPSADLLEAAALDKLLKSPDGASTPVFCVTFPVLYRQKHIRGAKFAGPGNKQEGLDALQQATSSLDKKAVIVLYCGCCPMSKCPNVRPAYQALKQQGFKNVRVLNLPTNFHTDWVAKGYAVEE